MERYLLKVLCKIVQGKVSVDMFADKLLKSPEKKLAFAEDREEEHFACT